MPTEGINPIVFPEPMAHLWAWFNALSEARGRISTLAGDRPLRITFTDMGSYFELIGMRPEAFEVEALVKLDRIALAPPDEVADDAAD